MQGLALLCASLLMNAPAADMIEAACAAEECESDEAAALQILRNESARTKQPESTQREMRPRVYHGTPLTAALWRSDYDFVVALEFELPDGRVGRGTGVASTGYILTAGHVVQAAQAHGTKWRIGTATAWPAKAQVVRTAYTKDHDMDLGMLFLDYNIVPKADWVFSHQATCPVNLQERLVGYGLTEHGPPNRHLVTGDKVVNRCRPDRPMYCCTVPGSRTTGCSGDSGGPWLSVPQAGHAGPKRVWGLHRGAPTSDHTNDCGATTRVDLILKVGTPQARAWINQQAPHAFEWDD